MSEGAILLCLVVFAPFRGYHFHLRRVAFSPANPSDQDGDDI